ncbi:hypothetical protein JCM17823_03000 [Halorubrum gandharaense]
MLERIRTSVLFGLHQAAVAAGISLFPVAVFARQHLGIDLPIRQFVEATGTAYERAEE